MRFGYADPPYPGQARRHYRDHPDYAGEVDHALLVAELERDFCRWLFEVAGLEPDDEFVDLFPGSGAVAREWERWRCAPRMRLDHPLDVPRNARRALAGTHPELDLGGEG